MAGASLAVPGTAARVPPGLAGAPGWAVAPTTPWPPAQAGTSAGSLCLLPRLWGLVFSLARFLRLLALRKSTLGVFARELAA